jgi:ArsR family transcriptional regulator
MKDTNPRLLALHAELCKVFSNEVRLRILDLLRFDEFAVQQVAAALALPIGTVSPHLLMMKRRRVLESRRDGVCVLYRLANPKLIKAFDLIHDILLEQLKKEAQEVL